MAKKAKARQQGDNIEAIFEANLGVERRSIGETSKEGMFIYGVNVKYARFIPSIADGLKPVERRVLYSMYASKKMAPTDNHRKSLGVVGDASHLHPHGDSSIYESMTHMAQPLDNIEVLIDGQGGFGTVFGDPASASRYTEVRLSLYAWKCFFEDFDPAYVNMKPSFTGEQMEPEYLPSRYPNVLINNTFGIGYGVSTGLPTYNLKEVLELTKNLMDDPEYPDITLIPDVPTWAHVVDEGQFKSLSETGEGNFKTRGEIIVDEERNILIVRSTPMHVSCNKVKQALTLLSEEGKVQGIIDYKFYAKHEAPESRSGFEMHIILKKEVDPHAFKEMMYRNNKIRMELTTPINFKLIDEFADVRFNIRTAILRWLDYRRDYKRRVFNHKYIRVRELQHLLETILMIFKGKNAEKALKRIREAEDRPEIQSYLMEEFGISSIQAQRISRMELADFSKKSIARFENDLEKTRVDADKYSRIIRSATLIDKLIKEELDEGIKLFGKPRRSIIVTPDNKEKIRNTQHVVVFTREGLVKKLPAEMNTIGTINQGDHPIEILPNVSSLSELLVFDQNGRVFKLPVHQIKPSELESGGEPLTEYFKSATQVRAVMKKPNSDSLDAFGKKMPIYLLMLTKNGTIKKTMLKSYMNIKNELLAMALKEDDELKDVKLLAGDKDLIVYTNNGMGVRFASSEIKETNRMTIGIKAIDLEDGEFVVGMNIVAKTDKKLFCLTSKGNGKTCTLDTFQATGRASRSVRIITVDPTEEVILLKTVKGEEKFNVYLRSSIEEIELNNVPELPRLSKGRKLVPVAKGNNIIDIKEVK